MNLLKMKINYLLESCSLADMGLVVNTSGIRISEFLRTGEGLSDSAIKRIEKVFANSIIEEKLSFLEAREKISPSVKNYDEEELSCIKHGTNRSGVNRQSSSFATSNNGWTE